MDSFYECLVLRAATIDELLSDGVEALRGQRGDAYSAARRLASWCEASSNGDWSLFAQRLERDQLSIDKVLERFGTVRRKSHLRLPAWTADAIWIEKAIQNSRPSEYGGGNLRATGQHPFEHLFIPCVEAANGLLWSGIDVAISRSIGETARAAMYNSLLEQLCTLAAPALYECFQYALKRSYDVSESLVLRRKDAQYDRFISTMKKGGLRQLFRERPILLRLIATVIRQWIELSYEMIIRLAADYEDIRRDILTARNPHYVVDIKHGLSDLHNNGRSVKILSFDDGSQVVYKPKELRLDAAWYEVVNDLNRRNPPIDLRAVKTLARKGYGWTECISHEPCQDKLSCGRFFRRAGALLALLHCFVGTDIHRENVMAAGEHPVALDLEMILQPAADELKQGNIESEAFDAAMQIITDSVTMVGLLRAYGRWFDTDSHFVGNDGSEVFENKVVWESVNTDKMRLISKAIAVQVTHLPVIGGKQANLIDYLDTFVEGFASYASFLVEQRHTIDIFRNCRDLRVRKVIRPTRLYHMLLERLTNHHNMKDGVEWSAQIDFIARFADWGDFIISCGLFSSRKGRRLLN